MNKVLNTEKHLVLTSNVINDDNSRVNINN